MATLQRIRNRAGLLVALIIGMAIFAFVLQDLLTGGKTAFTRSQFVLAEIAGNSVQYEEYANRIEKLAEYYRLRMGQSSLDEQTMESVREQTWQNMVREYVTQDEYEELGIAVSTDELMDMVQGRNPHPVIRQLFSDPQTGVLNRSFLVQFIRTMDQDPTGAQKTIWLYLEDEILKDRSFTKYNNLIKKGLYVTELEAENNLAETSRRTNINYMVQRFNSIPDSAIRYTENDLQRYYREHENDFQQEAGRDIEYVVFEVVPSAEDDRQAREWIDDIRSEFETVEDPVALVNMESDIPFDDMNYMDGELSETINDFMFSSETGAVYGPYKEESSYRIARLVEINYLPDSVHARHILLQPDASTNVNQLQERADSLQDLLNNGYSFELLARQYSADATAQQGGDLGWFAEGMMVKPFSDSCFYGEPGRVMQVQTQFGIHLVEILEKRPDVKKVKVAYMARNIEPSSETYQKVYSRAVRFAGMNDTYEKFNEAIATEDLTKRYATDLTEDQQELTGLENPRPLIRWAFEAELHEMTDQIYEFGNKYVVSVVTGIREEGVADFEQVRSEIELEVRKEKKAEKIRQELQAMIDSGLRFYELAEEAGLPTQEANNINFASVSLPNAGIEPNVIAAASVLAEGAMSDPIEGNNGVYVIEVTGISEDSTADADMQRTRMTTLRESQANFEAYAALQEAAEIEDNRYKFF